MKNILSKALIVCLLTVGVLHQTTTYSMAMISWLFGSKPSLLGQPKAEERLTLADDYIGLQNLPKTFHDFVNYLLIDPALIRKVGARGPWGIILYDSSGNGKTYLAECLAGTMHRAGIKFYSIDSANIAYEEDPHGVAEALFEEIKSVAQLENGKSIVIFFDDAEELFGPPHLFGNIQQRFAACVRAKLVYAFDWKQELFSNVRFVFATDRLDLIDPAMYREGRLRVCAVPYPERKTCVEILAYHILECDSDKLQFEVEYAGDKNNREHLIQQVQEYAAKLLDEVSFCAIDQSFSASELAEYKRLADRSYANDMQKLMKYEESTKKLSLPTPVDIAVLVHKYARGGYRVACGHGQESEKRFIPNKYLEEATRTCFGRRGAVRQLSRGVAQQVTIRDGQIIQINSVVQAAPASVAAPVLHSASVAATAAAQAALRRAGMNPLQHTAE